MYYTIMTKTRSYQCTAELSLDKNWKKNGRYWDTFVFWYHKKWTVGPDIIAGKDLINLPQESEPKGCFLIIFYDSRFRPEDTEL